MSDRSMKELINRWKEKAKRKGAENRKLRKHLKQLTKKFNQAKEELQKYKNLPNGTKATQRKPAKEKKKAQKILVPTRHDSGDTRRQTKHLG